MCIGFGELRCAAAFFDGIYAGFASLRNPQPCYGRIF